MFTPKDRAFDCAHIAYDCNDRPIQELTVSATNTSPLFREASEFTLFHHQNGKEYFLE